MDSMEAEARYPGHRQEFIGLLATHGIVGLMMVSVSISFTAFLTRLAPGWPTAYVPWLTFLVALEAMYAWRFLHTGRRFDLSAGLFRLGELIVLLAAARLGSLLQSGAGTLVGNLSEWRDNPLGLFFPAEFLVVAVFLGLVWLFSNEFAADLSALGTDRFIIDFETLGIELRDRSYARRLMANRIFIIGIGMVALTALVRSDLGLLWGERGSIDHGGINVLVYFILALALLSLTQFSVLRARWAYERIPLEPRLAAGWAGYSLLFFGLATGIALALPSGYSIGILQLIWIAVGYLYYLLFSLLAIFLLFLARLLSWVTNDPDTVAPLDQIVVPTPPVPAALDVPAGGPPWLEIVRSVLFWLVFVGLAILALSQYAQQVDYMLENLRRVRGLGWAVRGLQALLAMFRGMKRGLDRSVQAGLARLSARRQAGDAPPRRWMTNPLRLSPRDRIQYFYLAMIRRGRQQGHPRKDSQTPYEYAGGLKPHLGPASDDLDRLTETFLEARYSRQGVGERQAGLARRAWRRLYKAFQDLGRKAPG